MIQIIFLWVSIGHCNRVKCFMTFYRLIEFTLFTTAVGTMTLEFTSK